MTHKLTLHPISFTSAFLTAALSTVVHDEFNSNVLKGISAAAFTFGIYNLYHENRLKRGFQKSYASLSECYSSLTNGISSLWAKSVPNVDQSADIAASEQNEQSNCKQSFSN